jgi:hypothetical protein
MAILIARKQNLFRVWTTISDGYLTDWLNKKNTIKYLKSRVMEKAKMECEEIEASFPHNYWNKKDDRRILDEEGQARLQALYQKRINKN